MKKKSPTDGGGPEIFVGISLRLRMGMVYNACTLVERLGDNFSLTPVKRWVAKKVGRKSERWWGTKWWGGGIRKMLVSERTGQEEAKRS